MYSEKLINYKLLFSFAFIISIVLCFNVRFETNDDVIMLLISSGVISGTPDEHLIFIGIPLGKLLKFLYQTFPNFENYTLLFYFFHILSTYYIISFITRINTTQLLQKTLLLLFLSIEANLIIELQFTTTSAVLAVAGFTLIFENKTKSKLIGYILFATAFSLRFHAAILVLLMTIPFTLFFYSFNFKKIIKQFTPILIISSSLYCFDNLYYSMDEHWREYKIFNELRGKINDNPNYYNYRGHSEIDMTNYSLVRNFVPDLKQTNSNKLDLILKEIKSNSWRAKISNVLPQLQHYQHFLLFLIVISISIYFMASDQNKKIWLFTVLLFGGILALLSMEATLKPRVFIAAFLPLMILVLPRILVESQKKWTLYIPSTLILLLTLLYSVTFVQKNQAHAIEKVQSSNQTNLLNDYFKLYEKAVFIAPGSFQFELLEPTTISNFFKNKKIVIMGWLSGNAFENQIKYHTQLIDENVLFINNDQMTKFIPLIIKGIKLNYNIKAQPKYLLIREKQSIIYLEKNN